MKRRKRSKAYAAYREKFYAEKRIGNTKQGVRVLTAKQYRRARKEGINDTKILEAQTMLHGQAEKKAFWREYKKARKRISRGETLIFENKYIKSRDEEGNIIFRKEEKELAYHYNLSGVLKDKEAIHILISYRILNGEDREEVLADYGY